MNPILERLHKWSNGSEAPPEMVQIYPTNKCNLKCIFCTQRQNIYNLNEEVFKKKFLEVSNELCEMGVKKFLISGGGEPLCRPETTFGIMKIIKSYETNGRMITNGTLWTEPLIKETIKMGWDTIIFSLDAPDAETHDYLRGVEGALKRLINTVRNFKSYKERVQSRLPSLEFTTVLNKHNFKKIPEIVEVTSVLGVESINLEPLCINNKMAEKIKLNNEERKIFFEQILPRAEDLTHSLNIRNNFSQLKKVIFIEKAGKVKEEVLNSVKPGLKDFLDLPCYEPWLWPKIEANGEVWPCSTIQMKTNIKDRSFKSIWYGSEFQKFRNQIMNKDLPDGCENCVLTHIPCNREIKKALKNSDLFKFH